LVKVDNIIAFPGCAVIDPDTKPAPILTGSDYGRIEVLRQQIHRALLCQRCNLDRACEMISGDRATSVSQASLLLFALLKEHGTHAVTFYRPGAQEFSSAEIWISRVLRAVQHGHERQADALIAWRIEPIGRRRARFLIGRLLDSFLERDAA